MATVFITKTFSVRPGASSPQEQAHHQACRLIPLSNLDRKCPLLMYLVLFYRSPPPYQELSEKSLFTSLRKGLEETLSTWFPAAGRLVPNPFTNKLDLLCDNSGALLVEAATDLKISELGDLSQYHSFLESLVFKPSFSGSFSDMPLVVVQVTRFGCGGYAVGVGTSHSLFDAMASYNFLRAWASKTSGRDEEEVELIKPVHGRERLLVGENDERDEGIRRVMAFDHLHLLMSQAAASVQFSGSGSKEDIVLKTYVVSKAMVERLKSKVNSGMSGSSICTSFEAVAAHLWKARTKALSIPSHRTVCLQFAVDTRTRLSPPLPRAFAGNAYVLSSAISTSGDLTSASLGSITTTVKQAKLAVTAGYVKSYLAALELQRERAQALPAMRELTMISDWTRTPYNDVDFGHGKALYASPLVSPVPQLACFMKSVEEEEGMHVRIGLEKKDVEAFSRCFLGGI